MYNGSGLATARGSGTNGHVQRNQALGNPRYRDIIYRSVQELATIKQPNREILEHERKRKIELKCAEFAEILEEQGFTEEAINSRVKNYRNAMMRQEEKPPVDQWGKPCVTETHQVAVAQQEKIARLRDAFGISKYFVDGGSFDPDRQAKENLAKSSARQEKEKQRLVELEKEKERDIALSTRSRWVHTPSPERSEERQEVKSGKTKRKQKYISGKSKDRRKNKKSKKEYSSTESSSEDDSDDDSSSEYDRKKQKSKKA